MSASLQDLGLTDAVSSEAHSFLTALPPETQADLELGRVVGVERATYQVWTAQGPEEALLAGTLRQRGAEHLLQPVIGDWLVVQRLPGVQSLRIVHVLPRRTTFARAVNGGLSEQIITANVDIVFIVTAPGEDFDVARLGRYITAVQRSGAQPVVLLNKTDLSKDPAVLVERIRQHSPEVPVHEVTALQEQGVAAVRPYFRTGVTVALIGSSGVGKSTLTNALLGKEVALTGTVRPTDQQGRHTTTGRTLYALPGGGLLIDNPGLRDIAVWDEKDSGAGFEVIEETAAHCRFRKCTHTTEPGCAVKRAVQQGIIPADLLAAYQRTQGLPARRPKRS
ncbi:ribosome small subunit-dependent GTPase A (plasmid) [Deinococcus sp. KNUC1210]|uniref:ribosome small subunit-dependent GTPase A n=1 Tax=Deinococcus sp. KNUC1210 TaxID=2917691 RepID=UPI001EF01810|nr:ribosome small subunit-dependent GTPase A [Deinococcus sp. KNUC1210]ULH16961.1 ribosome small subunit-dependent GTPase A [Deinococcus sp. KNUC1210]